MYSLPQLAIKYLGYYLKAHNSKGHGMHSPFVFTMITKVLSDRTNYPAYSIVESLRDELRHDDTSLVVEDFGAGSVVDKSSTRKVSAIARHAAKPPKYGQLLYRMIRFYQPATILELGTSLGITTSYLSLGNANAKVVTMEGASSIAAKADENFRKLGLTNITIAVGNFDDTLAKTLTGIQSVDFVFVDGNHRREPTERYFRDILPFVHNDTMIVFDDIHWSAEMEQAWKNIQQHPSVRCTIDLFFIGIVLFRKEFKEKQDFVVRF
jgi:predicted O-methyltransferase YrrM